MSGDHPRDDPRELMNYVARTAQKIRCDVDPDEGDDTVVVVVVVRGASRVVAANVDPDDVLDIVTRWRARVALEMSRSAPGEKPS